MSGPLEVMEGPAEPPRSNGELVFQAPWESRAFGLAIASHDRGLFAWEDFRQALIGEIGGAEPPDDDDGRDYYVRWLEAFERILERLELLTPEEVESRRAELSLEDDHHDHDHDHDHDQDHDHHATHSG